MEVAKLDAQFKRSSEIYHLYERENFVLLVVINAHFDRLKNELIEVFLLLG
jgi:hypothetical protein